MASAGISSDNNFSFIEKNISNLKSHFKVYYADQATVKILENVGDIPCVIKCNYSGAPDLNITLQILGKKELKTKNQTLKGLSINISLIFKADYSLSNSNLFINSVKKDKYDGDKLNELNQKLKEVLSKENDYKNSDSFLVELFTKCLEFIDDNFCSNNKSSARSKTKAKTKNKSPNRLKNDRENKISDKKPSMKTANDVVNRIQWDKEINKENIVVGYLDRFLGIKECTFNTFDWGDIVLADINALAIPEHRIQYFKVNCFHQTKHFFFIKFLLKK
jgi:hypothetical protein